MAIWSKRSDEDIQREMKKVLASKVLITHHLQRCFPYHCYIFLIANSIFVTMKSFNK
jgi:hypothetical protein